MSRRSTRANPTGDDELLSATAAFVQEEQKDAVSAPDVNFVQGQDGSEHESEVSESSSDGEARTVSENATTAVIGDVLLDISNTLKQLVNVAAKQQESMDKLESRIASIRSNDEHDGKCCMPAVAFEEAEDSRASVNKPGKGRPEEYEIYPVDIAYKIYKSAIENSRCKKIGDGSFFDAKRTWLSLLKDFPIRQRAERRLMPSAFTKDAQRVYEDVASANMNATSAELWDILETRLCNLAHRSALQDKFFGMKWNERHESVATYAEGLRSAAIALPTPITNDVLLNRFKAGLPSKLQDQAVLLSGDFDTVVSSVSRLSSAQQMVSKEFVREVGEQKSPRSSSQSDTLTPGDSRFAHAKCHYCQLLGHIACFCDKKKADKAKESASASAGEGPGGAKPPKLNLAAPTRYSMVEANRYASVQSLV